MNARSFFRIKQGSINADIRSNRKLPRDNYQVDIFDENKALGINRTKSSVSLLASLNCIVSKTKSKDKYVVDRKIYRGGEITIKPLGIFHKREFFQLALTLNPQLGRDE